jgi:hypothetical protein
MESGTIIEELSDKKPYVAVKDGQANNEMGDTDPLTPLKVRPVCYKRYINRYVALVKK